MTYADPARRRAWYRASYARRRDAERARSTANKARNAIVVKAWLAKYISTHPCIDCGESDPIVLEYDHRDPKKKRFRIAQMRTGKYRLETVIEEVAKCDVRCANCHRRRTHEQRLAGLIKCGVA